MKRLVMGLMGVALAGIATLAAVAPATAAPGSDTLNVKWATQAILKLSLTPNYASGFGQVQAVFGTQPAPTHGPNASSGGGAVDFGNIEAGNTYIYKYAAHVNVETNDPNGVKLFGEGLAAFTDNTAPTNTYALNSTLFYANSTSGSPADGNTGFTPGFPFQQTTGIPTNPGYSVNGVGSPAISYGGLYPAVPVGTSGATGSLDFYYDYIMKVPPAAVAGQYYVWIVYTVVGN